MTGAASAPTPTTRPRRRSALRRSASTVTNPTASDSDTFENPRRALPRADAHRHHAVLEIVTAQRMHDGGSPDRSRGTERVAERDRTAHRVDLCRVQPEAVDDGERLRRESLVQLDPADVVELQIGVAQGGGN